MRSLTRAAAQVLVAQVGAQAGHRGQQQPGVALAIATDGAVVAGRLVTAAAGLRGGSVIGHTSAGFFG
jgi:hypothetical protein